MINISEAFNLFDSLPLILVATGTSCVPTAGSSTSRPTTSCATRRSSRSSKKATNYSRRTSLGRTAGPSSPPRSSPWSPTGCSSPRAGSGPIGKEKAGRIAGSKSNKYVMWKRTLKYTDLIDVNLLLCTCVLMYYVVHYVPVRVRVLLTLLKRSIEQ